MEVSDIWFVIIDEEQTGPITLEELFGLFLEGIIDSDSFIWRPDYEDWKPAHDIHEFRALLANLESKGERSIGPSTPPENLGYADSSQVEESPGEFSPDKDWYVILEDERVGPMSLQELKVLFTNGSANWDSFIWRPIYHDWKPAREVPELFSLFTKGGKQFVEARDAIRSQPITVNRAHSVKAERVGETLVTTRNADPSPASNEGGIGEGFFRRFSFLFRLCLLLCALGATYSLMDHLIQDEGARKLAAREAQRSLKSPGENLSPPSFTTTYKVNTSFGQILDSTKHVGVTSLENDCRGHYTSVVWKPSDTNDKVWVGTITLDADAYWIDWGRSAGWKAYLYNEGILVDDTYISRPSPLPRGTPFRVSFSTYTYRASKIDHIEVVLTCYF